MYFSSDQSVLLMTKRNVASGLPSDLRECYHLLLKYPHIWFPIVLGILGVGYWAGKIHFKIEENNNNNNLLLSYQKEMNEVRKDERDRCDKLVADYKELIEKLTPNTNKNETK